MDGVECFEKIKSTGVDKKFPKRLYNYIDAGYQYTEATTGYTGEVVYRKTAKTETGAPFLLIPITAVTILPYQLKSNRGNTNNRKQKRLCPKNI